MPLIGLQRLLCGKECHQSLQPQCMMMMHTTCQEIVIRAGSPSLHMPLAGSRALSLQRQGLLPIESAAEEFGSQGLAHSILLYFHRAMMCVCVSVFPALAPGMHKVSPTPASRPVSRMPISHLPQCRQETWPVARRIHPTLLASTYQMPSAAPESKKYQCCHRGLNPAPVAHRPWRNDTPLIFGSALDGGLLECV